jgi:hypothetical protein
MTNAIKVLLQMTSVSLQPVPTEFTYLSAFKSKINVFFTLHIRRQEII